MKIEEVEHYIAVRIFASAQKLFDSQGKLSGNLTIFLR